IYVPAFTACVRSLGVHDTAIQSLYGTSRNTLTTSRPAHVNKWPDTDWAISDHMNSSKQDVTS
ncbi:unnamed protein product, partial [Staurois parvus]